MTTRDRHRHVLATASMALSLSLLAVGCGSSSSSAAGGDGPVACPSGTLRFGVEPFEDPAKLTPAYQTIGDALGEKLGCTVEIQVVQDYSAEVLAMQNGKLEIGQFGPLGYVFAHDRAKAEAVVSFGTADGTLSTYDAGIWVPVDSPIQSVEDLKGHSLALSEPGSTSGDALPREAILDAGMAATDVNVTYAGGHPEALLALTNGKVDAAEINSQQLATSTGEGAFDPSKFRKVWTSDPIPNDPITVAVSLDPAAREAITTALTSLDPAAVATAAGFLDVSPAGALVPVTQQDYQPLFDLAATLGLTEGDI